MRVIPSYWRTGVSDVDELARRLRRPHVRVIARSPGGRPVYAFCYGDQQADDRRANYSSACGARDRRWYRGFMPRPPVLMLIGAVHGQETEGVAALYNLMELLETGRDLRGDAYPEIARLAALVRLVIVPIANPDGRARVEPASLVGVSNEELRHWGQGRWLDGTLCGWPECKQLHPIKDAVSFLGGYYNDDGVNLMHDQFFHPMAAETQALLDLADEERADWIIQLHGGSNSEAFLLQPSYMPLEVGEAVHALAARCDAAARLRGLRFTVAPVGGKEHGPTPPSFNLCSALHHVCGGVSCVFESNQAVADQPGPHLTHDQIYATHWILFEQCLAHMLEQAQ